MKHIRTLGLLVPLVIACSTTQPSPSPRVSPSVEPAASGVASPSAAVTVPPATTEEGDWGRITSVEQPQLADRYGSAAMAAVAARESEIVAVGQATVEAAAWYSVDGASWTRAEVPSEPISAMLDVAVTSAGYVAVGISSNRAAAWTSPDGRTWLAATVASNDGAVLRRITRSASGLLAQGGFENNGMESVAIWSSTDGRDWTVLGPAGAIDGTASSIASAPVGYVVVGARFDGSWKAATWTSPDGVSWVRGPDPDGAAGANMTDLTALDGQLVAVGMQMPEGVARPAAWFSTDGSSWRLAEFASDLANRDVYPIAVAPGGRGLVATGPSTTGTVGVWISDDGTGWITVPNVGGLDSPRDTYGTYQPTDIAVRSGQLVIVGNYPRESWRRTWSAAIWLNPAPPPGQFPTSVPPSCPNASAVAAVDILDLEPGDRLRCFGRNELTFVARIGLPMEGDGGMPFGVPEWLTSPSDWTVIAASDGSPGQAAAMGAYPDPERFTSPPDFGWYLVTGHFDDPRAMSCRSDQAEYAGDKAITECRQRFVMTSAEPTTAPG